MPMAIRVHRTGGPEVLSWEEAKAAAPGRGEIRVRHTFVGLNFIDVYHRRGLYKGRLPFVPGQEAAGVIEDVGEGVAGLRPGDRVAYATAPFGAYAEERTMAAHQVVLLPASIDDRTAAAVMLKGLTAQYLLHQTIDIRSGDAVLVHAAAGGVGLLLGQWARHLGATVIGSAGSASKAELARAAGGCHHVIVYGREPESFAERVRALTGGQGVRVVYDSVGKNTFAASLDCLRPRGLLVSFGQASGAVPPLDVLTLSAKGSIYLTRPTLAHYASGPEALHAMSADLFEVVASGAVRVHAPQSFSLREAAAAHTALEERRTTGSTVLVV